MTVMLQSMTVMLQSMTVTVWSMTVLPPAMDRPRLREYRRRQ
jgi:hypothetical protein